ncbi:MAG: ribose-phosphate pyrophosphokinase [Chlamydiae bacterium]|nr:ribose-phosphate pyrophosphokinase [Chlamydiota bacterium]
MQANQNFMLFSGTSHESLGQEVASLLGIPLGKVLIETFPDKEIGVQILENVRGRDVFVLQSIARRPNFYLMELLILIDALKRASARSIIAVIPYFGYARQDRKDKPRVPITAKLVANLLEKAGATRVLTMDLHTEQIQGFFDIPVDNLYARPLLANAVKEFGITEGVVVTPDIGSIRLAREFAHVLGWDFAIVDKRRVSAEKVEANALIGDVKNKTVLFVDDMCSTGGTLQKAAKVCQHAGAKRMYAAITHGLFLEKALEESAMEKIFVSNTTAMPENVLHHPKLQVVSIASLFSKAIHSIVTATSISSLFD